MAWVGPAGARFHSWWLAGDRLLVDADPWTAGSEDHFPNLPGLALSYQWQDSEFDDSWEPAPEYPPIVPVEPDQAAPPVRPRAVGWELGCPVTELRFGRVGGNRIGAHTEAGDRYTVSEPPFQQYLFDLDRTGQRLLVVALSCTQAGGGTQHGLAVFERAADGWQGISVLRHPAGHEPTRWWMDGGRFQVEWPVTGTQPHDTYRWTGTVLEPVAG